MNPEETIPKNLEMGEEDSREQEEKIIFSEQEIVELFREYARSSNREMANKEEEKIIKSDLAYEKMEPKEQKKVWQYVLDFFYYVENQHFKERKKEEQQLLDIYRRKDRADYLKRVLSGEGFDVSKVDDAVLSKVWMWQLNEMYSRKFENDYRGEEGFPPAHNEPICLRDILDDPKFGKNPPYNVEWVADKLIKSTGGDNFKASIIKNYGYEYNSKYSESGHEKEFFVSKLQDLYQNVLQGKEDELKAMKKLDRIISDIKYGVQRQIESDSSISDLNRKEKLFKSDLVWKKLTKIYSDWLFSAIQRRRLKVSGVSDEKITNYQLVQTRGYDNGDLILQGIPPEEIIMAKPGKYVIQYGFRRDEFKLYPWGWREDVFSDHIIDI